MEVIQGLTEFITHNENEAAKVGQRIFLPSSFVGGPRHMHQLYQDAIYVCCTSFRKARLIYYNDLQSKLARDLNYSRFKNHAKDLILFLASLI